MNTQHLLARAIGFNSPGEIKRATATRLVYALQPSPATFLHEAPSELTPNVIPPAHKSGVNAIAIDRFEGRYLLSGGANSSIALWDLESPNDETKPSYRPLSAINKSAEEHKLGITQVGYFPFDSLAFLTSSYDHTVKIFSSETMKASASFDLNAVAYNIALSPIANHLLVACATQYPAVRLIDLRSGASSHSLPGHSGAVLSTAWSPVREHILASGATDGSVRFWDVRRGSAEIGILDLEDSIGIKGSKPSSFTRNSVSGQAHRGPVNGIVWTEDGRHLVTCGHDQRIRVWDTDTYANTLANFGPMVRNSGLAPCIPVLPPRQFLAPGNDMLFYPNGHEILEYELFEGKLVRKMRRPERHHGPVQPVKKGTKEVKDKVMALAWRADDIELYSGHADGTIAAWKPRTEEDAELDEEEEEERDEAEGSKKRKRNALEEIYQDLTKRKITFGGIGPS